MSDELNQGMADAWAEEELAKRARESGLQAPKVSSDDMATAISIGKKRDLPPLVVADNLPDYKDQEHLDAVAAAARANPGFGLWLQKPENAALAKDDLPALQSVSEATKKPHEDMPWYDALNARLWSAFGVDEDKFRSLTAERDRTIKELGDRFQVADVKMFADVSQAGGDYLAQSYYGSNIFRDMYQKAAKNAAAKGDTRLEKAFNEAAAQATDPLGFEAFSANAAKIGQEAKSDQSDLAAGNTRPAGVSDALNNPGNTVRYYGGILSDSTPAMLLAMATRNPQAASAVMGASTGANTYADARAQGTGKLEATAQAVPQAMVESVFSELPFMKAFAPGASRFVKAPLTEAVSEGVTTLAQTDIADAQTGKRTPFKEKMLQAMDATLVGGPSGFIEATLGGNPEAKAIEKRWVNLARAVNDKAYLDKVVAVSQTSKLLKTAPGQLEDLLQSQVGDSMVYVPTSSLEALFQSENLEPSQAVQQLTGDANAWAEAVSTGGPVAIPMARYIVQLGAVHDQVGKNVTLNPDTVLEAHDAAELQLPTREQIQKEILTAMQEGAKSDERDNGPSGRVYDDIYGQLIGRTDEKSARQQASVVQSLYRNLGERIGVDAYTLSQRFKINIGSPKMPAAGRPRGIDTAIDPLIESALTGKNFSDKDIYGGSLLFAIVELGGINPESVGGGDLRSMDAQLRPGLLSLSGMTAERMAQTLADRGFNAFTTKDEAGRPDYRELLNLISDELQGRKVYSTMPDNEADSTRIARREAFRRDAEAIAAQFSKHAMQTGKPITDLSPQELRDVAMHAFADESNNSEALDQSANDQTATPEFKAWFGDSKVVDADGKPLVVYHGTGENFNEFNIPAFFSEEKSGADWFATDRGGDVVSAYLKIEKPLDITTRYGAAELIHIARDAGVEIESDIDSVSTGWDFYAPQIAEFSEYDGTNVPDLSYIPAVRDALLKAGYDGLRVSDTLESSEIPTWVAIATEQIKSATGNSGAFDANDPNILNQKRGEKGPRGQITGRGGKSIIGQKSAGGVREFNIQLLEGHDLSTFMHETGHTYLEILADLAADENAPKQIREDWSKIMAWLGVDDRAKIGRDQHEQFARGFEAYLREGKAPSPSLRSAFASFKVWLMAIYKSALSLNVELSDEVRGVFDRLLASDAEIAQAQKQVYHEALITDALAVGMSEAQHDDYQRAVQDAKALAESEVAAEVLKAEQRAQAAWWRTERKEVRAGVEIELRNLPVYRAIRWIRQGLMPDGTAVTVPIKISKDSLLDFYGPAFLKNLRGFYSAEGGMSMDEAASILGYASGGELVDSMVNAPKLQEVIESDTDRIMAERHPDPLTDGTLPDRAMEAVHSEKQADVMLREIKALEGFTGEARVTTGDVIREVARRLISEKRTRDIIPNLYRQAEAKAGREAFEAAAKSDWPVALAARRRQLLNLRLYQEAVRVRAESESIAKYLKRFTKNDKRAKLGKAGADYLEQIDGLLERFDFRNISGPAADRRGNLVNWILSKRADGVTVDLPPKLLDEAFRKPYKELTIAELRQVRDGVKHLAHLADLKNTLLLNGERRDREQIDGWMAASVLDNNKQVEDLPGEPSPGLAWAKATGWARATLGAATDVARRLDGYKDLGPVWSNTVGVIRDAINNRVNPALKRAQEAIAGIYRGHYTKNELRALGKARVVAGVPGTWSKGRILSLALNWGNEGNREAILSQSKKKLKPVEIGTLLGTLDARDWDFVRAVWDHVDSYWPEIAESQRRRKGLVPEKVEPSPFSVTTSDGQTIEIKGGYYPLKYEADTTLGMREEADDFYDSIRTGRFAKASTKDGHTIERTGSGGRSVQLDLDVLDSHLRNVIRDLHLGDAVNYVHQVLKGPDFGAAVSGTGNIEMVKGLDMWLRDVATGEIGLTSPAEKTARFIRTNFTASVLTYKFVSAALQVTGIIQTSVVLGKGHTIEGVARYGRRPIAMTKYVASASPFMASRSDTNIEAVQQLFDAKAGRLKAGHSAMIRWGYYMIAKVQQTVDVATWLGAEAKGMEMFDGDVKKARAYADDVVSRAQGSGEFMDKISLQRGTVGDNVRQSEWIRAATTLQGYMITKHNALVERSLKARRDIDGVNAKSVWTGMKWAGDMANLLLVEAIIVAAIRGALPGADDDDDGDGITDEWLSFAGSEMMGNLFGGIPGLGSMVTELRGYDSKGIVAGMWGEVANVIEQSKQGELDKAAVKASVKLAGYGSGIPASQVNKTIDAIAAEQDGEDVSPLDYLRGPSK